MLSEVVLHFAEALVLVETAIDLCCFGKSVDVVENFTIPDLYVADACVPDVTFIGCLTAALGEECGLIENECIAVIVLNGFDDIGVE